GGVARRVARARGGRDVGGPGGPRARGRLRGRASRRGAGAPPVHWCPAAPPSQAAAASGHGGRPPVPAVPVPTGVEVITTEAAERRGSFSMVQSSDAADVRGLQPLWALLDVVLHTLTLDQDAAAGALDRAAV